MKSRSSGRRKILSFLRAEILERGQDEFDAVVVRRQSFFLQVFLELLHELRAHAEDIQRFKQIDVVRLDAAGFVHEAAAFQTKVVAFEPDAAPEKLDDLRAFRLADIHQAHRADAPTAPAFREFLRADEHIDPGIAVVQAGKKGVGKWPVGHFQ